MSSSPSRTVFAAVPVALALVGASGAAAGQMCAAGQLTATGKAASAVVGCHAKAAKRGIAVDATCLAKADAKLAAAFVEAESKGGCPTTGGAALVDGILDENVGAFVAALRTHLDADRCVAAKLTATGKDALAELACHAAAVKRGGAIDPACLAKAEARLVAAFTKAESKPPCVTTGDAAAVAASVDDLVIDVLAALFATTTTTSVTTTTTTTIATGETCPCYTADDLANLPADYFDPYGDVVCSESSVTTADTCFIWIPGSPFRVDFPRVAIGMLSSDNCGIWGDVDPNDDGMCDIGPWMEGNLTAGQRAACIQLLTASGVYQSECQ